MSQTPSLQTVATLTRGASPVGQQAFVWGVPGRPLSVGTRGDWVVDAPGVEPVHFFLNFDGRMLHAASGPSGAPATVAGVQLDHTWRQVHIFGEIAFGGACLRITCEDAPPRVTVPPANPAPFESAPAPQPPDRTAYVRPGPLKTQPILMTPEQRVQTQAAAGALQVRDSAAPQPHAPGPSGEHRAAGALGSQPPQVIPTVHSAAPPGLNMATRASALPPGRAPSVPAPGAAAGPPVRVLTPETEVAGVPTMSDAGALRDLAHQVQGEPVSHVPAEAYLAYVQRASGNTPPPPAGSGPMGANPARPQSPSAAPGAFGSGPPRVSSSAPPPDLRHDSASADADAGNQKEKTSWIMRIVLLLLPVAGYFAIFWEPPSEPAPAEDPSATTNASATTTGSAAAHLSASARLPAAADAAVVPSAMPSAVIAAPTASGPLAPPASGAPVVAPLELSTASAAPPDPAAPKSEASASPASRPLQLSTRLARDALNAAFEGRMEAATERYDKLSTGADGETYRLSAGLIRARAIRKP